jgi:two-component system, sensor histidine kinase and response regulator
LSIAATGVFPDPVNRDAIDIAADVAGVGLWHWDLPSGRLYVDSRSATAAGLPGEMPAEEHIARSIHPEDLPGFRAALSSALSSPHLICHHVRVAGPDSAYRPVEMRLKVSRDGAGKASTIVIAVDNVQLSDERASVAARQAEAERALVERLSVATQAAGIYLWEFDWTKLSITWDERRLSGGRGRSHIAHAMGSDFFKWVHPDDQFIGAKAMEAAAARGDSDSSFRYRVCMPEGGVRHIQAYARTYMDAEGKPLRSLGVSWDVTNEVLAAEQLAHQAEELRHAQRRLERASLSVQEGHWEIDWLAQRHWGSNNYYALLGYQPGEISFETFAQLESIVHPDDLPGVRAATDLHIADGSLLYHAELRIAVKQGGYRWFRMRGSAERDATGRVIRMAGSISDIHQQKLAEDALRESQARFDRAVNGTQDGLWEADAVRGSMWLSPRACASLGYAEGELGNHLTVLRERMHPEDLPEADASLQVAMEGGLPVDRELRLLTKDGTWRWFRVRGKPDFGEDGKVHRMSGSIQDVTEARAQRDALIEASEAANAANRSKSAFIANVSHEIRTPMNGIIGMTSLLLDTQLDRSQREYADTIRASADALLTVINDILDFSKIEAGKLDIEAVEMDLPGNVEDVGSTLAFQAAAKGLELIVNVHPDVPPLVTGDPQRIRQCLINLIGNAIKFTRAGEIAVEVSREGGTEATPRIRFEVRDTGIGIAAGAVESLFQPFVQADVSTTRNFGGTGLGLSIVKRLVELMNGEVGVSSVPGQGSTFWFALPMPVVTAGLPQTSSGEPRTGRRVLVVDDNETNRRVIATRLAHAGYDVALASSGREALVTMRLALAASRGFDLVLSDFQMPDMDGAMLGERINTDPLLSHARVVLLTSVDRQGDLGRFASLGFAGYLTKPIRARELLACLDKVLEHDAQAWHAQTHPIVTTNSVPRNAGTKPYSGKVLLVEDNIVNQKVGQRFLERLGCEVVLAENGLEALEAWKREEFRLVLMDVQMPGMDGYTATRTIRDLEKGRMRTPIVALTANAMTGQLERCLQCGMDGLLTKPLEPERLEEVLDRFGLGLPEDTLQDQPARA